MFELIWRMLFHEFRGNTVEIISRLEKRMDRNEKIEFFLQKNAERFYRKPRECVHFVFYFGIVYGWLLSGNRNQEIEDLFEVKDFSDKTKETLKGIN